jgi:hypothetical protein
MTLKYSRRTMLLLSAVAALALLAAAGSQLFSDGASPAPDLHQLVGLSETPLEHLYADQSDAGITKQPTVTRSVSFPTVAADGSAGEFLSYTTFGDRSSEDAASSSDGAHLRISTSFYPVPPGELGRHPHSKKTFAVKGDALIDDDVRWYSGKRQQHLHVDDDGSEQIVDYAEDGHSILDDRWYNPPEYRGTLPLLRSEQRYRNDPQHTLSYSDQLNANGTRIATDWDEHHLPQKIITWANANRIVPGTTVIGYYPFPNNTKIRFQGEADFYFDTVRYYRLEDGSLSHILKIGSGNTEVQTYDRTGTKVLLVQTFTRHEKVKDGDNRGKTEYELSGINEIDADGHPSNEFYFNRGGFALVELLNATVGGVQYKKVAYGFNEDGTLDFMSYWTDSSTTGPNRVDFHPPMKHVQIDVPEDERQLKVLIDDDLPIPLSQNYTPTGK